MLEKYIADKIAEEAPDDEEEDHTAITAGMVLTQHADRLQITAAQREQLIRTPGIRVPAHIALREEEKESSEDEGTH